VNIKFYKHFKREPSKDIEWLQWRDKYPRLSKTLEVLGLYINFKLIKLSYCGLLGKSWFRARFHDPERNLYVPLRRATLLSLFLVYVPTILTDFVIFGTESWDN